MATSTEWSSSAERRWHPPNSRSLRSVPHNNALKDAALVSLPPTMLLSPSRSPPTAPAHCPTGPSRRILRRGPPDRRLQWGVQADRELDAQDAPVCLHARVCCPLCGCCRVCAVCRAAPSCCARAAAACVCVDTRVRCCARCAPRSTWNAPGSQSSADMCDCKKPGDVSGLAGAEERECDVLVPAARPTAMAAAGEVHTRRDRFAHIRRGQGRADTSRPDGLALLAAWCMAGPSALRDAAVLVIAKPVCRAGV